jgi:hypothetical protein
VCEDRGAVNLLVYPMAEHHITSDLLDIIIESRIEAGVDSPRIYNLIYVYAFDNKHCNGTDDIIGFLGTNDIPPSSRESFLEEVLALPTVSKRRMVVEEQDSRALGIISDLLRKAGGIPRLRMWPRRSSNHNIPVHGY